MKLAGHKQKFCSHMKYKHAGHMQCSDKPISQPSLEISPVWGHVVGKKLEYEIH